MAHITPDKAVLRTLGERGLLELRHRACGV